MNADDVVLAQVFRRLLRQDETCLSSSQFETAVLWFDTGTVLTVAEFEAVQRAMDEQ